MTPDFIRALDLARAAHKHQVDKAGRPYVEHLERVGKRALRKAAIAGPLLSDRDIPALAIAAVLHDIVEDTPIVQSTIEALFGPRVSAIVELVTKRNGEAYHVAIRRIELSGNLPAILLKLSDLEDNMDPQRRELLPEEKRPVPFKYILAHERLTDAAGRLGYFEPRVVSLPRPSALPAVVSPSL